MPFGVAARTVLPLLATASRLTARKFSVAVAESCFQATPSVVRKMPAPLIASMLKKPSPVPAYMIFGFEGSIARQQTARFAMKSSTGSQLVPPFSVRHTPPPTLPAHIVLGGVGWTTIERVRPPMLPGPSEIQPA